MQTTKLTSVFTNGGRKKASTAQHEITPEERYRMISEAAYFIAEKRGFAGGDPAADWAEAEAQVDRQLRRR